MLGINLNAHKEDMERMIKCYFFTKNRRFLYQEVMPDKSDEYQTFVYPPEKDPEKIQRYFVDISAVQFFTPDKKPVFFYIEGIPTPTKFDLVKYVNRYLETKRKDPRAPVFDDNGDLLDLSFSCKTVQSYKVNTLIKKLLAKINPEQMQIIMVLCGLIALSFLTMIILLFVRR